MSEAAQRRTMVCCFEALTCCTMAIIWIFFSLAMMIGTIFSSKSMCFMSMWVVSGVIACHSANGL